MKRSEPVDVSSLERRTDLELEFLILVARLLDEREAHRELERANR
jgi:hypothetical protein